MKFQSLVDRILLETNQSSFATKGIIFKKNNNVDTGCCIGVEHGKNFELSQDLIQRISKINNLKFYAEGIAAKQPDAEPGMIPFMQKFFPKHKIESESWDDITEKNGKGTANPNNNIYWMFANHEANKLIEKLYSNNTNGTILDALSNAKSFPKNVPTDINKRKEWISYHLTKAGFGNILSKKFSFPVLKKLMVDVEYSVYPNQQYPSDSYLGKLVHKVELERNSTIYQLMSHGGCCFAGAGHLIELKQQFPDLEIIGEDNI